MIILVQKIKVNDVIQLDIKRMGINGEGVGYYEKLAVFVDNALPGEKINAEITAVYDNRATAKILDILVQSKDRITPFCSVFDACGGCQTQHFDYQAMLIQKREILIKSLDRYLKKYSKDIVKQTIGMDDPMHYRNKASLMLKKVLGKNRFGMYERGTNDFIAIEDCGVQNTKINEVLSTIVSLMDVYHIDAYDIKTQTGFISNVIVRTTQLINEVQIVFVVPKKISILDGFMNDLVKTHPEIKSVYYVINDSHKQSFFTEDSILIYGKETIEEKLQKFDFSLKPDVFFQLNTIQADKFYQTMETLAELKGHEIIIDVNAGIAPISHYMHAKANKIYAIETNEEAFISAKNALESNHVHNVTLIKDEIDIALANLDSKVIDLMLLDPPKIGLGIDTIKAIKTYLPKRIIYGSSNPSTLAKDLSELTHKYEILNIIPFDMFPYTSLVESISLLELKRTF